MGSGYGDNERVTCAMNVINSPARDTAATIAETCPVMMAVTSARLCSADVEKGRTGVR